MKQKINYKDGEKTFLVTNIQRYSVNDGPGIRTTVFLKGCPLRCAWCHNPESINVHQEFFFDEEKCVRCGSCAAICPENAIKAPIHRKRVKEEPKVIPLGKFLNKIRNGTFGSESLYENASETANRLEMAEESVSDISPPDFDRQKCTNCMECVKVCAHEALYLAARETTIDEVYKEVLADTIFYETSGGGLTISGGEPLLQPAVTLELFKRARKDGIHTALDTTGLAKWEVIEKILPYVDLVLFDVKTLDDVRHKKWTGVSNVQILKNLRRIAMTGKKIRLRCVVVHNVNYWDLTHAHSIATFATELGDSIDGIDIIPFHNFAEKKYERLGRQCYFKGFPNIFKEEVEEYQQIIEQNCSWKPTIGGLIGTQKTNEETQIC